MSDTLTADMCEIHHIHPDKLKTCAMRKLDDETSLELADLFKVLGDKTRIKLLSLLAAEDELCVCDIAESLQMGQSAISHQLRVLRAARLVKFRKSGKEAFYSLDDDHVLILMHMGLDHVQEH
ncbi:DNA-binding transcriptional regulator, ArsR family [Selenomonas ruminantium]|jgi:DNA-binding transcriptional ArsR family regulator|uniref:DNA-binding transcriptional regulator, ArsR family n=2 Tax=Selenomonadaceae TaxID=1843491 RepID=A0A1K1P7L1_SELRU|nr:DNA-binding transcriptional regulator, ArsR family [Selenomonas ruminantium]SFA82051.1 DNA-binding transcriptional regulator, ArsR family [Selenomonas ruminantium]SFW43473.1 DNA-binding transcriptional regulator, ArsR family [Selenomonas ruminantium]